MPGYRAVASEPAGPGVFDPACAAVSLCVFMRGSAASHFSACVHRLPQAAPETRHPEPKPTDCAHYLPKRPALNTRPVSALQLARVRRTPCPLLCPSRPLQTALGKPGAWWQRGLEADRTPQTMGRCASEGVSRGTLHGQHGQQGV
jgi:hypothetical protein